MSVKTGYFQECVWAAQGETPTYAALGLVHSGSVKPGYPVQIRSGVHGRRIRRAGLVSLAGSVTFSATADSKALVQKALRASWPDDSLDEIMIHAGTDDWDELFAHAKIDKLQGSAKVDAPLDLTIDWKALGLTKGTSGVTAVEPTSDPFEWYQGTITVNGSALKCQAFDFTVENGLKEQMSLDSKAAGAKRLPESLAEFDEKHEITAEVLVPMTLDISADEPASNLTASVVFTDGTHTLTFSWTDLMFSDSEEMPFESGDNFVVWKYKFVGKPECLTIS